MPFQGKFFKIFFLSLRQPSPTFWLSTSRFSFPKNVAHVYNKENPICTLWEIFLGFGILNTRIGPVKLYLQVDHRPTAIIVYLSISKVTEDNTN